MAAAQIDLQRAGFSAVTQNRHVPWFGYLYEEKSGPGFRWLRIRKAGLLQPVEHLVRVDIVPACDLRNRHTAHPRLRADHPLLVITPVPTPAPLHHKTIP